MTNVRLLVATEAGMEKTAELGTITAIDDLTEALGKILVELPCDAALQTIVLKFDHPSGEVTIPCEDVEDSPESIVAYLWDEAQSANWSEG